MSQYTISGLVKVNVLPNNKLVMLEGGKPVLTCSMKHFEALHLIFNSISIEQLSELYELAGKVNVAGYVDNQLTVEEGKALANIKSIVDIAKSKGHNPENYLAGLLAGIARKVG